MENTLKEYKTSLEGLNTLEIQKRQEKYGLNKLVEPKKQHPIVLFLSQFFDALIALLLIAAIAAFLINDIIDASVILIAVLLKADSISAMSIWD